MLAESVKAYDLPGVCGAFGLDAGEESEAYSSKRTYVRRRIVGLEGSALVELGKQIQERFPDRDLEEALHLVSEAGRPRLSELTRKKLLTALAKISPISGRLDLLSFLGRVFPLRQYHADSPFFGTLEEEIEKHMILNDDWDLEYLFDRLRLVGCSEHRFVQFLELCVHPMVRDGPAQSSLIEKLNAILKPDRQVLAPVDEISGEFIYGLVAGEGGVLGKAKNLIFAANGPKPEIILRDAINNDIRITRNGEYCLVFDRPFGPAGLRWGDLVDWWTEMTGDPPRSRAGEESLYRRLIASLGSEAEKVLFRSYYGSYRSAHGWDLPALLPQVYLHYDPYTAKMRRDMKVLARQRMDFLLLFSPQERVVLEVDGKQHYSQDGRPSPRLYAEMAAADRELRLLGYEVFRFGGHELSGSGNKAILRRFFDQLLMKHGVAR